MQLNLFAPGTNPKDPIPVNLSAPKEVELRNFFAPVNIHYYPMESQPGWWKLSVFIESPERVTGEPGTWAFETFFDGEPTLDERADETRRMLHAILAHEVDENLYVNGVRRYDPHTAVPPSVEDDAVRQP